MTQQEQINLTIINKQQRQRTLVFKKKGTLGIVCVDRKCYFGFSSAAGQQGQFFINCYKRREEATCKQRHILTIYSLGVALTHHRYMFNCR